jgi:hypothetical protein
MPILSRGYAAAGIRRRHDYTQKFIEEELWHEFKSRKLGKKYD